MATLITQMQARGIILLVALLLTIPAKAGDQAMSHLDIIKSTYQGDNAAENARQLMRHLAEDVSWTEAAGFPLAGTYIGKQAIQQQVFQRLDQQWHNYQVEIERFIAEPKNSDGESHIIAIGSYSARHKQSGKSFSARVAHHWQLRGDKIIRFEQFVDSVPVVAAMQ